MGQVSPVKRFTPLANLVGSLANDLHLSSRPIFYTLLHDIPACFLCDLETEIPIVSNA